jgi:hypothetical protein
MQLWHMWKFDIEYWCTSTRLRNATHHHSKPYNVTVHAQSMLCAHFLFIFVSFFVWLFHFLLTLFVICLCIFRSYKYCQGFTFTHNSIHARVIFTRNSFKQGCIYVDPLYYMFISELFQCSLQNEFFAICSLAMIAFNFKVLRIEFNIKPLSASNWGTRPHKTHGIFHDVIEMRCNKRFISCWDLSWGYLFFV